jgi:hypothetical protein
VWEGVQIMELIECSTGALHLLARERACRQQMCDMQLVAIFVHVSYLYKTDGSDTSRKSELDLVYERVIYAVAYLRT